MKGYVREGLITSRGRELDATNRNGSEANSRRRVTGEMDYCQHYCGSISTFMKCLTLAAHKNAFQSRSDHAKINPINVVTRYFFIYGAVTYETRQLNCTHSRPEAIRRETLDIQFQTQKRKGSRSTIKRRRWFRAGLRLFVLPRQLGSHSLGSLSFADVGVPRTVTSCSFFRNAL